MADPRSLDLDWAHVYWTHEELFERRFETAEMIDTLGRMAVEDCLQVLSRLSCMVEGGMATEPSRQTQILRRLGLAGDLTGGVEELLRGREGGRPRTLFFPQQVVELTRLVLRHAAYRPSDGFENGELAGPFLRCIFGVTDLLGTEIGSGSAGEVRRYLLRQLGLMSRQESVYLFSRYYELLVRLWPRVHRASEPFSPAQEFKDFAGITLEEFFVVGFAVYSRFVNHVNQETEPEAFGLLPTAYFANTRLDEEQWAPFLSLLTKTPREMRTALDEEDAKYGPGLYRCHTFDRSPLVQLESGVVIPASFASLERAVTEGAFWILADAAEAKGMRRESFTGPFGAVFERFAQESLERIAAMEDPQPRPTRDFLYGPKRHRVKSSDMSFLYDREGVFFEVVTGQPSVATTTRGDLISFRSDLGRLVLKKANQLRRCWLDFFRYGTLRFDGVGRERIRDVWPVLILIEGFPLMPPIYGEVVSRLRRDGWPNTAPQLTLIDADELGALEALVEHGWSTPQVLRRWKREAPQLPMSNWLASSTTTPTSLGHASWHERSFSELTDLVFRTVFGKESGPPHHERHTS